LPKSCDGSTNPSAVHGSRQASSDRAGEWLEVNVEEADVADLALPCALGDPTIHHRHSPCRAARLQQRASGPPRAGESLPAGSEGVEHALVDRML
jgi:hypothetical protein